MERSQWEKILTYFQAHVRGYLVRKEIYSAREDFEDIVREIDGDLAHLEWRETIVPIPHFTDTDGPFLRPKPSCSVSKALKPAPDVSACPQNPPPASLSEERGAAHCLLPEKIAAERDDSHSRRQVSLSGVYSPSIPAGGHGEGQRDSSSGDQVGDEDGGVMESTGEATTVWSSLGLEMNYNHSHKGPWQYCLAQEVPRTPEALRLHRNTLAMELLWLQQAIASRKKYLSLKETLSTS
ncbi:IQ domain-containing protein C [Centroberyx affinis]|uniref:IQ domain-containing protein C n=1 Tax=Centroberyx affinis TaxID=166261 RepID=UPI003A5BFD54